MKGIHELTMLFFLNFCVFKTISSYKVKKKKKKEEEVVVATETSLPLACYLGLVNLDISRSLPGLSMQ